MIKVFLFLLFILCWSNLYSQQQPSGTQILNPIIINKDSVALIKKMRKFEYMNSIDSLLRNLKKNQPIVKKERGFSFIDIFLNSQILKVILYLISGFLLAWIAVKFWERKGVFKKKILISDKVEENEEIEVASFLEFNEKIALAVADKNYRLAIKFNFLQTLLLLSDKDLIIKNPGKTNIEYKSELPESLKSGFSILIKQYNYVWYGKMNIDEQTYLNFRENFVTFQNML